MYHNTARVRLDSEECLYTADENQNCASALPLLTFSIFVVVLYIQIFYGIEPKNGGKILFRKVWIIQNNIYPHTLKK